MENLIIRISEYAKTRPDQTITIPIAKFNIGRQLLPEKAKSLLEREAIEISKVCEFVGKSISKPKGVFYASSALLIFSPTFSYLYLGLVIFLALGCVINVKKQKERKRDVSRF